MVGGLLEEAIRLKTIPYWRQQPISMQEMWWYSEGRPGPGGPYRKEERGPLPRLGYSHLTICPLMSACIHTLTIHKGRTDQSAHIDTHIKGSYPLLLDNTIISLYCSPNCSQLLTQLTYTRRHVREGRDEMLTPSELCSSYRYRHNWSRPP